MLHVETTPSRKENSLYTECKRHILCHEPDAGSILQFLAQHDVAVSFAKPQSLSKTFESKADAGGLSVLEPRILLDSRKSVEEQADDLARRTRVLMQAPKPNGLERFLHDSMGVTFGRFMKLEQKDGLRP